jgi:uncharacterized protein YcnI
MVNKRRLLIAGIVLLLGLTAVFTVLAHNSNKPAKKQTTTTTKQAVKVPTAAELSTLLDNDDNPTGNVFTVTAVSQPAPGWIVAKVTNKSAYGTFVQYAIFQQGTDDYDRAYGPTGCTGSSK